MILFCFFNVFISYEECHAFPYIYGWVRVYPVCIRASHVRNRGKGSKECWCERFWEISREGCCTVFYTSENVLSAWQQINNPSITKHNAIKTAEYGRKQNHISEKNSVQYLRWHFLYLFPSSLCCFRGQELYAYWCAFRGNTLLHTVFFSPIYLVQITGPCFHFINACFFCFVFFLPISITHNGSLIDV